jgi:hypothetical protein
MGRAKRYVSITGELFCTICQRWVHIRNYRTREVLEDTRIDDIWFVQDNGRKFGRPDGYCRQCAGKKTQGADAIKKWQEELGLDATTWKDRWQAEQDKMDEEADQVWTPPEVTSAELAYETERLEKLYGPRPDDI